MASDWLVAQPLANWEGMLENYHSQTANSTGISVSNTNTCRYGIFVNTLRPRWNGHHFADDIFKCIYMNEIFFISISTSLKFVPKGPIDNKSALVQVMAWRWPGAKPLSEPMMASLWTHTCITQPQWVNTWRLISKYNWCFFFSGEQGRAVTIEKDKLSPEERKLYDEGWKNNAFNQYASDMISLHRSLPDIRDKG